MIRSILIAFAMSCTLAPVKSAKAMEVEEAFKMLSKVPADYFDFGSVCEQLARLQLYAKYPANTYRVDSGIVYTNAYGNVLGELDVVVFHKQAKKAVLIGEVKCWRNLGSAMKKAKKQLARFAAVLKTNKPIRLYKATTHASYSRKHFLNQDMRSIYISQNGGEPFGFHMTIGLEHEGVQQVRSLLLKCQKSGKCPREKH